MTQSANGPRRASYGIDAPYAAAGIGAVIVFEIVAAILSRKLATFVPVLLLVAVAASCVYTTRRGKFRVWAELLDKLNLRGDERILDLGCGRGAVLILAAKRLTSGRAVGVDLWRTFDQSGNSADATRRNAIAEGVADRVELHTADMASLPFADNSFDLVVSSLAVHNISGRFGQARAIDEAVRVLRPGGRLLIADIRATRHHQAQLASMGMHDVTRTRLNWRFWWGGPWAATRLVTATKPVGSAPPITCPPSSG